MVDELIFEAKEEVRRIVYSSKKTDSRDVIARYTATFAVNFTDWIGKTIPWTRHEMARYALIDNLRCEMKEDHIEMLLRFAALSYARPNLSDYDHVDSCVGDIRDLFKTVELAGIHGIAVCAVLENTSEIFIPDLASRAKERGCNDFTYTNAHGEADVEHSKAFVKALQAERTMNYIDAGSYTVTAAQRALALIECIYR